MTMGKFRMWDDQLQRMERHYRRCLSIQKCGSTIESVEDDNDIIYSFFIHCLHLKDWFIRDYLYTHGKKRCVNHKRCAECYLRRTPALTLCQDIANGIKHLNRDSAVSGRRVDLPNESVSFFVRDRNGEESDAFNAVRAAREAWKLFTLSTRAVESEEMYEACYGSSNTAA